MKRSGMPKPSSSSSSGSSNTCPDSISLRLAPVWWPKSAYNSTAFRSPWSSPLRGPARSRWSRSMRGSPTASVSSPVDRAPHCRVMFERESEDWLRLSEPEWRAAYLPELGNVRATLDWALRSSGETAIAIDLAGASAPLWTTLGLFREGVQRLEAAMARIEPHTSELAVARLWLWLGRLLDETPAKARPALERATELYRKLGDPVGLGFSLVRLGRVLAFMGKFDRSEAILNEARPLLERAGTRAL